MNSSICTHLKRAPRIHEEAWIAPGAVVLGDVEIGKNSSVWYQTVIRADIEAVRIGEGTNIQDGSVIHLASDLGVTVGNYVTVGNGGNPDGRRGDRGAEYHCGGKLDPRRYKGSSRFTGDGDPRSGGEDIVGRGAEIDPGLGGEVCEGEGGAPSVPGGENRKLRLLALRFA